MKKLIEIIGGLSLAYAMLTGCNGTEIKQPAGEAQLIRLFGRQDKYDTQVEEYVKTVKNAVVGSKNMTDLEKAVRDGDKNLKEVLSLSQVGKEEKESIKRTLANDVFGTAILPSVFNDKQKENDVKTMVIDYANLMNSVAPGTVKITEYENSEKRKVWVVSDENLADDKKHVLTFSEDGKTVEKKELAAKHQIPSKHKDYLAEQTRDLRMKISDMRENGVADEKVLADYFKTPEGRSLHAGIGFVGYRSDQNKTRNNAGIHSDFENHPEFNVGQAYSAKAITAPRAIEMIVEAQKGGRYVIAGRKLEDVTSKTTDLGTTDLSVVNNQPISHLLVLGLVYNASNPSRKIKDVKDFDERMALILDRTEVGKMHYQAMPYFK